ncbi:MAG TPA: EAL domain-containing protein [Actinoplanes sp.]|nr:EAL domain-containing protein [Actinoplanes sp.]
MRLPIGWYAGWVAALAVLCFTAPDQRLAVWALLGATSVAAILFGIRRNRPRRTSPWYLLAAAIALFASGDAVNNLPPSVTQEHEWLLLTSGGLYLAMIPLLMMTIIRLTRTGAGNRDQASALDSLALTTGAGLLLWIFLIAPSLRDPLLAPMDTITAVLFPLTDLVLLAAVTRFMIAVKPSPAVLLLVFGTMGLFVSDVLFGLTQLKAEWQRGTATDLGWIAFYALWGAAALHPSMVELTKPRILQPPSAELRRLLLPALSCLVGPVVLLVQASNGPVRDGLAIAVASAAALALSIPRVAGIMITHRHGLNRERGLRGAAAALVSATDAGEVEAIVLRTVADLIPRRAEHQAYFAVREQWAIGSVGAGNACLISRLDGADPVNGVELRPAQALLPDSLTNHRFELLLVCPLSLDGSSGRGSNIGVLLVTAAETTLIGIQGVLDVLTTQAALALDRIRLTADNKRQANDEYFRTLVQNAADIILIVEDDGTIRYASPSASVILDDDVTGTALRDLVHANSRDSLNAVLDRARADGGEPEMPPVLQLADGSTHIELACRDLREAPSVHGLVVTLRDVTTRIRMQRELHQRAYYDSLTGLANRTAFVERLTDAVQQAGQTGATVGVILLDLDEFKAVNDRCGHETGDTLLIAASQRLSSLLLPGLDDSLPLGVPARLGSDEFAVLVERAGCYTEVDELARRIVAEFAAPFVLPDGDVVTATTSAGVSTAAAGGETAPDMLRFADLALYAAKADGKARWVGYDRDRHMAMRERMELRADLHDAVTDPDQIDTQFALLYQPIVDLTDDSGVGFEALVRWQHPTRGMVSPLDFIDLAEESPEVISLLGAWVLRTGLATAARWYHRPTAGGRPPYVSINVSPAQFRTPGFADLVRTELVKVDLPPELLLLEITESMLLDRATDVWADLQGLQQLGVRVAIDDFGTGFSSLSYLQRAPVDVLKLDRSFTSTVTTSPTQFAVVDGVIRLAERINMRVVAEGIETAADRDVLRGLGCHLGQGYFYAKPMPLVEADRWFARNSSADRALAPAADGPAGRPPGAG